MRRHGELERSKMDQLRRREEEFDKKRHMIAETLRIRERDEVRAVDEKLRWFDSKIMEGESKHQKKLDSIKQDARMRNTMHLEKVSKIKEYNEQEEVRE